MARGMAKRTLEAEHDVIDAEMRTVKRELGGVTIEGIVGNCRRTPLDECGRVYKDLDFVGRSGESGKLEGLFKETETFWTAFKTKDAIDFSKAAQSASQATAAAAKDGNGQKAQAAYASIGKNCKGCHDSHRELMPDKSFKIKP